MPTWTLDWRSGPLEVTIPDKNLRQLVQKRDLPNPGPWWDLVRKAIEDPIGWPPLRELVRPGMRVAILLTDMHDSIFGSKDRVGVELLNYFNELGVPDRNVLLVHAAGLHGHADAKGRIGEEVLGRVGRYHEHDPMDDSCLTYVGATWQGTPVWVNKLAAECDFMIGFGGCGPSLFGFQGGAGIILPGIAGADTIRHNHIKIMTSSRTLGGWWPGNPQRMDVMDAADLAGFRFKIDFTGNKVFAGYFREEWPVAVQYVKDNMLTRVPPTDVYVLAPTHSSELANALYMGLEYGTQVVRPGGICIVCASAADHECAPPRPVSEILDETVYCTRRWNKESGAGDERVRAFLRKRDVVCKEELMRLPLSELSKILTRRQGEPRSTAMSWSHRSRLERTRTFLVTEGVSCEEGEAMGFAYVTRSFDDALRKAFAELGDDAGVVANVGGSQYDGKSAPANGIPYPADE